MEQIIKNKNKDLTEEERNLVSVASKKCVSSKRAAWRSIYGIEVKDLSYFYIELAFNDLNKVGFLLPWLKGYKNVHK